MRTVPTRRWIRKVSAHFGEAILSAEAHGKDNINTFCYPTRVTAATARFSISFYLLIEAGGKREDEREGLIPFNFVPVKEIKFERMKENRLTRGNATHFSSISLARDTCRYHFMLLFPFHKFHRFGQSLVADLILFHYTHSSRRFLHFRPAGGQKGGAFPRKRKKKRRAFLKS